MDLLDSKSGLNIDDPNWKIYARNSAEPPQYIAREAVVKNSIVSEGCLVEGDVEHSVISHSCKVGKGAVVRDSILMPGAEVPEGYHLSVEIISSAIQSSPAEVVQGKWHVVLDASGTITGSGVTGE